MAVDSTQWTHCVIAAPLRHRHRILFMLRHTLSTSKPNTGSMDVQTSTATNCTFPRHTRYPPARLPAVRTSLSKIADTTVQISEVSLSSLVWCRTGLGRHLAVCRQDERLRVAALSSELFLSFTADRSISSRLNYYFHVVRNWNNHWWFFFLFWGKIDLKL